MNIDLGLSSWCHALMEALKEEMQQKEHEISKNSRTHNMNNWASFWSQSGDWKRLKYGTLTPFHRGRRRVPALLLLTNKKQEKLKHFQPRQLILDANICWRWISVWRWIWRNKKTAPVVCWLMRSPVNRSNSSASPSPRFALNKRGRDFARELQLQRPLPDAVIWK